MLPIVDMLISFVLLLVHWVEGILLFFVPRSWYFKDVSKELVLITGAGSGVGRLLALQFASLGSKLILWDVNTAGNEETASLARKLGVDVHTFTVDVSKKEDVYATAEQIQKDVGSVTILINNAGIVNQGDDFSSTPDAKIERIFNINVLSHFWTVKAFLPAMKQTNHGHIVCMASVAGVTGMPRLVDYCATKFANVGFMESLSLELKLTGLTGVYTTTVCPIFITTGMFEGVTSGILPLLKPEYVAERIVTAIRNNQTTVFIPRSMYILMSLKTILPYKALLALYGVLGCTNSMEHFVGRPGCKKD